MTRFVTPPRSNYRKDYDPHRKLQKIPPGENFNIDVDEAVGVDVVLTNTSVANITEIYPRFSPTTRFFQVDALLPGSVKLEAKDGSGKVLDHVDVQVTAPPVRHEDLLYNGSRLTWFHPTSSSSSFRATSGLGGHQSPKAQQDENWGPIPEGTYSLLARRDPTDGGWATLDAKGNLDSREGIQLIPLDKSVSAAWGTNRVRLTPIAIHAKHRGGFYIHNSHKGYTHGCVETQTSFFDELYEYADSPGTKLRLILRVAYAADDGSTSGGTEYNVIETVHDVGEVSGGNKRPTMGWNRNDD